MLPTKFRFIWPSGFRGEDYVSCLQFNYLGVETLTPTWEDLVGQFGRTFVGVKSDKTLCPT
jgi:hypothetical protein